MARFRVPVKAIDLLKEIDPGCGYTLYALRQDIKAGRVPIIRAGRKWLVNVDALLLFLETPQNTMVQGTKKIHRIAVLED